MRGEACESSWCTCDTIAKVLTVGHLGDTSLVTPLVIVGGSFAIPREIQNGLRLVSETNLTDFNRVRPILPEWARAHSQPTAAQWHTPKSQRQPAEASTTRISMGKTSYINFRTPGESFRLFLCRYFHLCMIL